MHIRQYSYILAGCLLLALSACYKDKGNYTYVDPNKVIIDGIATKYSVMQGDYVEIIPQLTFTDPAASDSARYTYEWFAMKDGALVADKRKDFGTNKNLRINMSVPAGTYNVYYRIKDKETGIMFQKSFDLQVSTSIYEGWMVMCDVNGAPRLDMVSRVNGEFKTIPDVLAFAGSSLQLKGKPVGVTCYRLNALSDGYAIYISTDKTTDRIDAESFEYKSTLNIKYEMISNVPEDFAPSVFADASGYKSYMIEGTDAYYYYYVLSIRFGLPINIIKDEPKTFPIAPFMAVYPGATQMTIFYDTEHKRFVRHNGNESTCSLMPNGTLFDYNTGMDLVYMTYVSFSNGNVFAILHDKERTGKYMLARFSIGSNIAQTYYDEIPVADLAQATSFAVSPDYGYVFYTIGGKLYSYDMSAKASKLMIDRPNQRFTKIQFRGSTLVAGSVDGSKPEGSNGVLETYTVQPVQGPLLLTNTFTGLGKVVGFSYRVR